MGDKKKDELIPDEIIDQVRDMTSGNSDIPDWAASEVELDILPDSLDPTKLEENLKSIFAETSTIPKDSFVPKNGDLPEEGRGGDRQPVDSGSNAPPQIPLQEKTIGADTPGLTEQEKKYNEITAKYGLEVWDQLVKTGSVMVYGLVNNPKEVLDALSQYEDIINSGKSLSENQLKHRKSLQEHVADYEKRKGDFAFNTHIDIELKELAKDMTEEVMNAKGIKSDPSLVLILLLFAPVAINMMRVVMDKIGYRKMIA